jgi:hypothetical protein
MFFEPSLQVYVLQFMGVVNTASLTHISVAIALCGAWCVVWRVVRRVAWRGAVWCGVWVW